MCVVHLLFSAPLPSPLWLLNYLYCVALCSYTLASPALTFPTHPHTRNHNPSAGPDLSGLLQSHPGECHQAAPHGGEERALRAQGFRLRRRHVHLRGTRGGACAGHFLLKSRLSVCVWCGAVKPQYRPAPVNHMLPGTTAVCKFAFPP